MDLAKIAWIEFSTPALGNVAIAALGGDFAHGHDLRRVAVDQKNTTSETLDMGSTADHASWARHAAEPDVGDGLLKASGRRIEGWRRRLVGRRARRAVATDLPRTGRGRAP